MSEQKLESLDEKAGTHVQGKRQTVAKALFVFALFLFLFVFFLILALLRPADVDEGFFLVFGKSIFLNGRTLYLDFFSNQMPLLPYLFGLVMRVFGFKWAVARVLCALVAAAIGAVLCRTALERTGSRVFSASIAVLYCCAPFVFIWFTCVRTHGLATLFLLMSISLLRPMAKRTSAPLCALAGFFVGLSIDTCLYIIAVTPVLAFHVSLAEKGRVRRAVPYFLGGVALGLLFNLPFFIASPVTFVWDVFGFHSIRSSQGLVGNFGQKLDILLQIVFDYPPLRPTLYLGYLAIFGAYLASQILRRIPLSEWHPAFYLAGAIFFVSLLPTPAYGRYFVVPIPFFILLAIDLFQRFLEYTKTDYARKAAVGVVGLGAIFFAYFAVAKIDFYILKGNNLGGSMPTEGGKDDWRLDNVKKVSEMMDRLVAPDGKVLSLWPGYLLESRLQIPPRNENLMVLEQEDRLSEWELALAQTMSDAEIREGIRSKEIDLVVYGNSIAPHVSEYKALLIANGYTVAEQVGGISLYLSPAYNRDAVPGL